jgi:hypothetical protein
MDVKGLMGTYLRLREELGRTFDAPHRRRLSEEMAQLESRLARECSPFAETVPLEFPGERSS